MSDSEQNLINQGYTPIDCFYAGTGFDQGTSYSYFNPKIEGYFNFKSKLYLSESGKNYQIGTPVTIYEAKDGHCSGLCFLHEGKVDSELVLKWKALQKAKELRKTLTNRANDEWAKNLEPIRQAYKKSSWKNKEAILAVVIRAITS